MYFGLLHTHNLLRYIILILFVVVLYFLWNNKKSKTADEKTKSFLKYLSIALDIQLIVGIVLYFFASPLIESALKDFGSAMKDSMFRFYAVEHVVAMLISIVLVHISKVKINKGGEGNFMKGFWMFNIAFVILFLAIPWPFYSFGRALF